MTIRAYRYEVFDCVNLITLTNLGNRDQVMNNNIIFEILSIKFSERKAANFAIGSIVFNTGLASLRISLISVHADSMLCPLWEYP